VSEESHAVAIKAALTAAGAVPYDYDEVPSTNGNPGTLPQWFTAVGVTRRFGGNFRTSAQSGVTGWRITTLAVGNNVTNARNIRLKQHQALEGVVLTINGEKTTPIALESADQIEPDGARHSGLTTWTYAL
jgi:hypothetical protein